MSQLRRSFEWLRIQWKEDSVETRVGIVFLLLLLSPFILIFGLIALVYEVITSFDRSGRISPKAQWAMAILLVFGGLMALSAVSRGIEGSTTAVAAVEPSPTPLQTPMPTPPPMPTPTPITQTPVPTPTTRPATIRPTVAPAPTFAPAPTAPRAPAPTPVSAAAVCAGSTYDNCVSSVNTALSYDIKLFAICEYEPGLGDVVLLDPGMDADDECSGGGLISPSRVFKVVQAP